MKIINFFIEYLKDLITEPLVIGIIITFLSLLILEIAL